MTLRRAMSLGKMVDDFSETLGDYARWPDVPARQLSIDQDALVLSQALHGFDPIIPTAIYLLLISELIHDVNVREIPRHGLRAALLKLADVIDPPKQETKKATG